MARINVHPHPSQAGRTLEQSLGVVALCGILFVACNRQAPTAKSSSLETSPSGDSAQAVEASAPAKTVESTEVRQAMVEAETSLRGGSYDEAAARLLKMRISGAQFSQKDAAAYRDALQEAYSRALEAASRGDPRGKAAVEMIRAARPR
jgi:hypothetical protein